VGCAAQPAYGPSPLASSKRVSKPSPCHNRDRTRCREMGVGSTGTIVVHFCSMPVSFSIPPLNFAKMSQAHFLLWLALERPLLKQALANVDLILSFTSVIFWRRSRADGFWIGVCWFRLVSLANRHPTSILSFVVSLMSASQ
jgi:hypothetical protein